jgi:hypothetical protein
MAIQRQSEIACQLPANLWHEWWALLFVWGETANYGAFLDAGIDDTEKPTFWAILSRVPQ